MYQYSKYNCKILNAAAADILFALVVSKMMCDIEYVILLVQWLQRYSASTGGTSDACGTAGTTGSPIVSTYRQYEAI